MIGHAKQENVSEVIEMKNSMLILAQTATVQTSFQTIKEEDDANIDQNSFGTGTHPRTSISKKKKKKQTIEMTNNLPKKDKSKRK